MVECVSRNMGLYACTINFTRMSSDDQVVEEGDEREAEALQVCDDGGLLI